MRIVIGSDHAGYEMKEKIVDAVKKLGYEVTDVGTHEPDKPDDYPDFAQLVAQKGSRSPTTSSCTRATC